MDSPRLVCQPHNYQSHPPFSRPSFSHPPFSTALLTPLPPSSCRRVVDMSGISSHEHTTLCTATASVKVLSLVCSLSALDEKQRSSRDLHRVCMETMLRSLKCRPCCLGLDRDKGVGIRESVSALLFYCYLCALAVHPITIAKLISG